MGIFLSFQMTKGTLLIRLYERWGYYCVLFLFTAWIVSLIYLLDEMDFSLKTFFGKYRTNLFLSLCIVLPTFYLAPLRFRVLSDETGAIGTSRALTFRKHADLAINQLSDGLNLQVNLSADDKRPLVYPFFINLINSVFGYRPTNGFVINFIALWALMALLSIYMEKYGGLWPWIIIFFIASQQIFLYVATSCTVDMLALLFSLICLLAVAKFLVSESDAALAFLLLTLGIYAQIRTEGPVDSTILLLGLGVVGWKKSILQRVSQTPVFWFMVLMCFPIFWHNYPLGQQMTFYSQGLSDHLFHWHFFWPNLKNLILAFTVREDAPFSAVPALLFVLSLIAFCTQGFRWRIASASDKKAYLIWGLGVSTLTLMYLVYFWGNPLDCLSSRYYAPFSLAIALFAVSYFAGRSYSISIQKFILVAMIMTWVHYLPYHQEDLFNNQEPTRRENIFATRYLERWHDQNILLVANREVDYTIYDHAVLDFTRFLEGKESYLNDLKTHVYTDILIIQTIDSASGQPCSGQELPADLPLALLAEYRVNPQRTVRISKIVSMGFVHETAFRQNSQLSNS